MERTGLHPLDPEGGQAGPQFRGRPGGEGHREDVGGGDLPGQRPVGDPVGDRPGLAGAGAGQDAHRPGRRGHRRPLLVVQPRQYPLDRVTRHSEESSQAGTTLTVCRRSDVSLGSRRC